MDGILLDSLLVVACLFVSAFFSAAEIGVTASSRAKIHKLKSEGNWRAKLVSSLRQQKEKLIGGILLGNNVVNVLASAITTSLFISLFGEDGVLIATGVVTVLVVLFGEVLPKTYALTHPEKVAMWTAPLLSVFIKLLAPFTISMQFIVRIMFRVLRISDSPSNLISGTDALRGAIELQHQEGSVVKTDRDMLGSILDLSEREVGEIMIHRKNINMIDAQMPLEAMMDVVLKGTHSRLPVYRNSSDNIIGVLHVKDLLRVMRDKNNQIKTENVLGMLKKPWFVPETTKLKDQLHAFTTHKNHLALVVDEYGSLMGLVTLEDILEEIVGQIEDEHDVAGRGIRKEADGGYLIEGGVTIRDINRELDWKLPDAEATTIAGLLMHEAQLIPEIGQTFEFFSFRFQVIKKQRNQLLLIRVKRLPKPEPVAA